MHRRAGRDDLVTGRDNRDTRPAPHLDRGPANCGKHADLARGQDLPSTKHGFAAGEIAAGEGDELAGGCGPANFDQGLAAIVDRLGVLDHDDGVGAARHHPAGRDQSGRAWTDREHRHPARGQDFGDQG